MRRGTKLGRLYCAILFVLFAAITVAAQESDLGAALRRERHEVASSCSNFNFKALTSCGTVLFTGKPLRIAAENFPPGNSFGLGLGFHKELNTTRWRNSFDAVGEGSFNASWRGGLYSTFAFTGEPQIVVSEGNDAETKPVDADLRRPTIHAMGEAVSLNRLAFYGLGNATNKFDRAFYGMDHRYLGVEAELPLRYGFSLQGEFAGRWYDLRGRLGEDSPSIEQEFSEASAPGIGKAVAFLETGEGIGFARQLLPRLRVDYSAKLQQFHSGDHGVYSFRRFTLSGDHEFALLRTSKHPSGSSSRDKVGSIAVGGNLVESIAPANHVVPFYLQPTLGGSDINHTRMLASYPDYRFRAPNYWLARARFDHSIYGPVSVLAWSDVGRVALTRSELVAEHLRHSFGIGCALKAGNFPYVSLSFAWGGREGTHINTDIRGLGQMQGPSLF